MIDIKAIRTELGMSQAKLAEAIGISQPYLSRYESGDIEIDIRTERAILNVRDERLAAAPTSKTA